MRALSFAFGLVMVAAATVQGTGPGLVVSAAAFLGVLVGVVHRPSATLAVAATAVALALSAPSPVVAAIAGLAATGYLVLRHARGDVGPSMPTVIGALVLSAAAVLGAAIPLALPWVPLVAPLAVVAVYVAVVAPLVSGTTRVSRR